jgi:hypothetical protein
LTSEVPGTSAAGTSAALIAALRTATNLATDPDLARFKPTAYSYRGVPRFRTPGAQLYEYRLHGLTRVVVCHFAAHAAVAGEELALLVAIIVTHDHERLIRPHPGAPLRSRRSGRVSSLAVPAPSTLKKPEVEPASEEAGTSSGPAGFREPQNPQDLGSQ